MFTARCAVQDDWRTQMFVLCDAKGSGDFAHARA